jgi:hypothetical protein
MDRFVLEVIDFLTRYLARTASSRARASGEYAMQGDDSSNIVDHPQ